MAAPADLETLSSAELKALVVELLSDVADLRRVVSEQREEIARHCHGNFGLTSGDLGRPRSAGHAVCRAQVS